MCGGPQYTHEYIDSHPKKIKRIGFKLNLSYWNRHEFKWNSISVLVVENLKSYDLLIFAKKNYKNYYNFQELTLIV